MKYTFTLQSGRAIQLTQRRAALFLIIADKSEEVDTGQVSLSIVDLAGLLSELDLHLAESDVRRLAKWLQEADLITIEKAKPPQPNMYGLTDLGDELLAIMTVMTEDPTMPNQAEKRADMMH
jgi:hypothetical protein